MDALVVWFRAELCQDIVIDTSFENNSCWQQAIFPLVSCNVKRGEIVPCRYEIRDDQLRLSVDLVDHGKELRLCDTDSIALMNESSIGDCFSNWIDAWKKSNGIEERCQIGDLSGLPNIQRSAVNELPNSRLIVMNSLDVNSGQVVNGEEGDRCGVSLLLCWPIKRNGTMDDLQSLLLTRQLHPDAFVLPNTIKVKVCLVESIKLHQSCVPMSDAHQGVDLNVLRSFLIRDCIDIRLTLQRQMNFLSEPVTACVFQLNQLIEDEHPCSFMQQMAQCEIKVSQSSGRIHALLYWFEAEADGHNWSVMDGEKDSFRVAAHVLENPRVIDRLGEEVAVTVSFYRGQLLFSLC